MSRVLNVILSHQSAVELEPLLKWWSAYAALEDLLVTYGGTEAEFKRLPEVSRVFVSDPQLRVDKVRDKQSYAGVWQAAAEWLMARDNGSFTHVYFVEFDHLPLVSDLSVKLVERLEAEQADVLGHRLRRIDGTSNVHYLFHLSDPAFMDFWRRISVRANKETVLGMLSTGSLWTREAFLAVAAQKTDIAIYLEIYLPTIAHHLGFRVRRFLDQGQCVFPGLVKGLSVDEARRKGCWTVHPIKTCPLT
jgi:hypothetical protein